MAVGGTAGTSADTAPRLRCTVFVGASIDGFIARPDGSLDFLDGPPTEEADDAGVDETADTGYEDLLAEVDVLVMGRTTYDVVAGLVDLATAWPWPVPVVVLTTRPLDPPADVDVRPMAGTVDQVATALLAEGWTRAYVDGGDVVQQFLAADLVDRLTVTTLPVLVGAGVRLFGELEGDRWFTADEPRLLRSGLVRTSWRRAR